MFYHFLYIYTFIHSDPWVTTSCINQDLINILGNALHRDICGTDIPCLGFCSWDFIPGMFMVHRIVLYNTVS